jgi:MerR family transcriptional regulator, light-induced transcriptional regulator
VSPDWEYRGDRRTMGHPLENNSHGPRETKITELAEAYTAALLSGDEVAAEITVREAMDADFSAAEIDELLIAPALWLVGELWERGEISVADEHLATEISVRVLALQREAQRVVESRRERRVMLATPTGEHHLVALRMVANLLRGAGYDVVTWGTHVPPPTLGGAARRHRADIICLSSTMPRRADHLLDVIDDVRLVWPSARFVLGGRGLPIEAPLRAEVHVCGRVSDAVEAVDALVKRAGLN